MKNEQRVIVGEHELGERLIAWAESLTPQEKKQARDALYRHFKLEGATKYSEDV